MKNTKNIERDKSNIQSLEQRADWILDIISTSGFGSVSDLARRLEVSEMTIRRDLDKLEAEGHIRRTHGGAIAEQRTQVEIAYRDRKKRRAAEKEKIGALAARLVESGQRLFLDAGTTVLAMVEHLKKLKNLQIITTSLPIQAELIDSPGIEAILAGGQVLSSTMSLVGTLAQDNISTMRFDWAFLGTGGIDIERGLTHSTMEEIPVKKAAAASASKVAVLADHTKFAVQALALFMPIDDIDIIITDSPLEELQGRLSAANRKTKLLWP